MRRKLPTSTAMITSGGKSSPRRVTSPMCSVPGRSSYWRGNGCWRMATTRFPSRPRTSCNAKAAPMESPSGDSCTLTQMRWCDCTTARKRAAAAGMSISAIFRFLRRLRLSGLVLDFTQQLIDVGAALERRIVDETQLRHGAQAQVVAGLAAQETGGVLQAALGLTLRPLRTQNAVEHLRHR